MIKELLNKIFEKKLFVVIIVFLVIGVLLLLFFNKDEFADTMSYNGKTYVCLEYNMDIFTYGFNSSNYYETDVIYPVSHDKWDIIYFNEDLFILDSQVKEAKSYYADDSNYEWSFIVEDSDFEKEFPILINDDELKYLYDMDNMKKDKTMLFSEIEKFGTLKKVSKDNFVYAIITLAYFEDSWYFRTEVIDDSKENDPEYVIKLPDSINEKVFNLLKEYNLE